MFPFFWRREPKPFNTGYLPEVDGHRVFFQEFGNPQGRPILAFHGGPGSCSKPVHTRAFDLKKCRVILFDQRGRGKSLPPHEIKNNTLADTVEDARRIFHVLNLDKAVIYGGSWGSTVALVFAETYPDLIERLIVAQTFLARNRDIEWTYAGTARFYPEIMHEIMRDLPDTVDKTAHYAKMAASTSKEERIKALNLYGRYEHILGTLAPALPTETPTDDHLGVFAVRMHYEKNNYFLKENQILDNIATIADIPTLIVHNRLDMVCPVEQSWELHRAMKKSRLVIVPDSGHGSTLLYKTTRREVSSFLENNKDKTV